MKKKILLLMSLVLTVVGAWAQTQTPVVTVDNIGTAPYKLDDADAAKIFELENLTVVLDVTTAASLSGRGAFFCVADPAQPVPSSFSGNNTSYMACGHVNASIAYIAAAKDGQHFSTGTIPANSTIRIAYVFDKTNNKFKSYIGDTNTGWTQDRDFGTYEIATPKMVKEDFANANIYIGGGMANNEAHETGDATIHKVRVYDGTLTVDEIKNLDNITNVNQLKNVGVYKVYGERGFIYATDTGDLKGTNVASATYDAANQNHHFAIIQEGGNYYLYNIGAKKFVVKDGNSASLSDTPDYQTLTMAAADDQSTKYDWVLSLNGSLIHLSNAATNGVYTNSSSQDAGTRWAIGKISEEFDPTEAINVIKNYARQLYVKAEVEGLEENNPNTHFGQVRVTTTSGSITTKLNRSNTPTAVNYAGTQTATIDFTRPYRGFEFQGFYLGGESLGKEFTLTEAQKSAITEANPLVAKFTTTEDATLFYDDDPFSYRIPAIGKTSTGRLIAVSDYRHNLDDIGRDVHGTGSKRIDLVMRYSDDNGVTWSEKQTIAEGTDDQSATGYDCAYGDAAIAAVGENVLVMAAAGNVCYPYGSATSHNRTVRVFSADNGATWTKEDISEKMFISSTATIPNGHTAFFGSGKLAVDPDFNGTGRARIYGGMLVKDASTTTNVYVVYTDDLGENWKVLGGVKAANADEPKVEILPNGQILLSARRQGGRLFNVFTYGTGANDKANGTGTWNGTANGCNNGGNNGTNGEIFLVDAKKSDGTAVKLLMQSQPKGGSGHYDRKDVTIWYKEVDANTTYTTATIKDGWTEGVQVSYQQSSYSVATLQTDGRIGFFFEEAPCYGDDYTKGYCMVYVPLTIEKITKGNYFTSDTDLDVVKTINVVLTDAQGNTYRDQVECLIDEIATTLTQKYPFITLGDNASYDEQGETCTYTNTVELPFKVSNGTTTIWHNIYFPINTNEYNYPAYMSGQESSDVVKICTESAEYGNSTFNTFEKADYISWAIYQSGEGFSFILKNKLTNKYLKTTSVAGTGTGGENVKYTDNIEEATPFILSKEGHSNNYLGEYNLKIDNGCICVWSVSNGYATYSQNKNHKGAWVKFKEAPDFTALIASINESLGMIGTGLGQYEVTNANATKAETAKTAMQNSGSVKLNELNGYTNLLDGATLNTPIEGQFFRIAYDYGGSTGKLYMQSAKSSVKGLQFTSDTDAASIWVYYDDALYSYTAGQCLRENGDDRGLQTVGGKTTVEFSASTRAKGKYNVKCGSFVHANNNGTNFFTDHCSSDGGHAAHDFILEEVTSLPVIVSSVDYATFYSPVAVEISEGLEVYYVYSTDGGSAKLQQITGIIPANQGVILKNAGEYNLNISNAVGTLEDNKLFGTVAATNVESEAYVLSAPDGVVGLYKAALNSGVFKNNAFKAYLPASATTSNVKALLFDFGGETTGVHAIEVEQVNAPIYDLSGRRVLSTMKGGIYIQNGKKFIVR